jgi:hypothetical protein
MVTILSITVRIDNVVDVQRFAALVENEAPLRRRPGVAFASWRNSKTDCAPT